MYDTLWNIIQSGDYDLPDVTRKIDIFYAEGKINDDQRADLMAQAVEHADPERERPEVPEMLQTLADRMTACEEQQAAILTRLATLEGNPAEESETPQYPAWRKWDGLSKLPGKGDIVSHNGKLWRSKINLNTTEPGSVAGWLTWEEVTTND